MHQGNNLGSRVDTTEMINRYSALISYKEMRRQQKKEENRACFRSGEDPQCPSMSSNHGNAPALNALTWVVLIFSQNVNLFL